MRRGALALALALALGARPAPVRAAEPLFVDATPGSGVPALRYGEGVNAVDLDDDGLPELFLPCVRGRDRLLRNRGGLRFEDVTEAWGIAGEGGIGAVVADFDQDGRPEIAVARGAWPSGSVALLARGGDGRFADAAPAAGVATKRNGLAAAAADVDADGRLDLFVSTWGGDLLWRNEGGSPPRFAEVAAAAGLGAAGRSWGALFADFSGDGLPDLFVARGGPGSPERSRLYRNGGGGRFEDVTAGADLGNSTAAMGGTAADVDADGDLDLFVTSFDGRDRLYLNDGAGRLRDATGASGIDSSRSVGASAGCVDGDLLPDLVVAGYEGPVRFFRNLGGGRFADATAAAGLQGHRRNEGVVLADLDRDGDLDLYVTNLDGANRLYRNTLDSDRYLRLVPPVGAAGAHGATAWLARAGDPGPGVAQTLSSGTGFCSQGPPEFLFRLPDAGPWRPRVRFVAGTPSDPAADGETPDPAAVIPDRDELSPLRRGEAIDRRTPETLWELINGQAELYRDYGLLGSAHAEFTLPGDDDRRVVLSVFVLGQPLGAFGLFGYYRSGDCAAAPLGNGACLGDRQAFLWSGRIFVLADAFGPDDARPLDLRRTLAAAAARLGEAPPLPLPLAIFFRAVPEDTIRYQPRHVFGRETLPPGLEGRWQGTDCFVAAGPLDTGVQLSRYQATLENAKREERDGLRILSGLDPVLGPVTLAAGGGFLVGARSLPDTPGLLAFLGSLSPREGAAQ